jgi:CRISPR-associated protein Cas2
VRHLVISYDVVSDRKRARLAKFLRNLAERVQKSVFEGEVDEGRVETMKRGIEKIIDREEDSVRIYTLCARCRPATEIIGTGVFIEEESDDVLF